MTNDHGPREFFSLLVCPQNYLDSEVAVEAKNGKEAKMKYSPKAGKDAEVDVIKNRIEQKKKDLDKDLAELNKKYGKGQKMIWIHRAPAFAYEVEVPENVLPTKFLTSDGVQVTSTRKGFVRFQTKEIQNKLDDLEHLKQVGEVGRTFLRESPKIRFYLSHLRTRSASWYSTRLR